MRELKIRPLTVADRDWISRLIRKLVEQLSATQILRLLVFSPDASEAEAGADPVAAPGVDEKRYALLVIEIIKMMIDVMGSDVREWFASLIGVSVEEFTALPIDTELVIIEQLIALEESDRFFSRALALSSKMKMFVDRLKSKSAA